MVDYSFSLLTFEYFLLILVRISCFVFIAPFFGMSGTPGRMKIGLSFFVTLILYQIVPKEELAYAGIVRVFHYSSLKKELQGLLIGFAANICNPLFY